MSAGAVKLLCYFGMLLFSSNILAAAPPSQTENLPSPELFVEIENLIIKLGNDDFSIREQATESLMKIGMPSFAQVEQGTHSKDLETKYRCESLMVRLRNAELQDRLERFAADTENKHNIQLPAWERFAKLHGDTKQSRHMFVEIFRAEPELLKTLSLKPEEVPTLLVQRSREVQLQTRAQIPVKIGSVVGFMFASNEVGGETAKDTSKTELLTAQMMTVGLWHQPAITNGLNDETTKATLRSVLSHFMEQADSNVAIQAINFASNNNMPEALQLTRRVLDKQEANHNAYVVLTAIAKLGDVSDIPRIEKYFEQKQSLWNFSINNQMIKTEIRDVALITALHLIKKDADKLKGTVFEGGDIKAFGFERYEQNGVQLISPQTVGFTDDTKRDKVFANWKQLKQQLDSKK
jgi:hypothetical protein